jgi:hypothetical protein
VGPTALNVNIRQYNRFFNRIATVLLWMVGVGLLFAFGSYLVSRHTTTLAMHDPLEAVRLRFEVGLVVGAGVGIYVVVQNARSKSDDD